MNFVNFAAAKCAMIAAMRAAALPLLLLPLAGCDVTMGEEKEFEEAMAWVETFRAERPDLARDVARECAAELPTSPYANRKDSLDLVRCLQEKAAQRGYR